MTLENFALPDDPHPDGPHCDDPHWAVAVGECMVELSADATGGWHVGMGGDTLNTAIYLSRLGSRVSYLTVLGTDPFSTAMRRDWEREGLDTSLVLTDPDRLPGIYAIHTDAHGERSFHYWREASAARQLFTRIDVEAALARASRARLLYVSGITLSLYDAEGQGRLRALARAVRAHGGAVAFDPNYRARGWPGREQAAEAFKALAPHVSIALPTFDDERMVHGDKDPLATAWRWRRTGVAEVVVKAGSEGCLVLGPDRDEPELVVPAVAMRVIDTTGAGDSFNAAYLAARRRGASPRSAAEAANHLAGVVIGHRGAIIPENVMPAFD